MQQAQADSFAQVRGGVTYFGPTAHAHVAARQAGIGKRQKAAIPIVDPSELGEGEQAEQQNGAEVLAAN